MATPIPVSLLLAPGADPADAAEWDFNDITTDAREAGNITIQVGRQDESSRADATQVRATLVNRTGTYSPRNPLGALYGQLAKGSPIQVRIPRILDTFSRTVSGGLGTDAASGLAWTVLGSTSLWSTNGSAALATFPTANVAGTVYLDGAAGDDVNVVSVASVPAVMTGAAYVHATLVRYQDSSNYIRIHTEFGTGGQVGVRFSRLAGGVNTYLTPVINSGLTYAAGTKVWTRVHTIGALLKIRVWLDGSPEPLAWTATATESTVRGQATGLYEWRVSGNTNAGSVVCTIDNFRVDVIRASTPVPEWPVKWDLSGRDATAPITGSGILRRLSQGQSVVRSPMRRQISQYKRLVGYWPLEDDSAATRVTNTVSGAIAGGASGQITNMSLGSADAPGGATSSVSFNNSDSTSRIRGNFLPADPLVGWQFAWACKLPSLPSGGLRQMISWRTNVGDNWAVNLDTGVFDVRIAEAASGGVFKQFAVSYGGGFEPNQWMQFRMKVTFSGGTTTCEFAFYPEGSGVPAGVTDSFFGTPGYLTSWSANGNNYMANANLSHVYGVTTGLDNLQSYDALRAFDGYAGELAGDRMVRMCGEAGIPFALLGDAADTAAMGPQTPSTLLDNMRECEDADQGILHERGPGFGYLTRVGRYIRPSTPAALALDFNAGHVASPPEPVDDDQRLRNKITLKRSGGSEVSVQDDESIAASGLYEDEVTANLAEDLDLVQHAWWRLNLGTADEVRWPRIDLKLHRNPQLIADWCKVRIGSRITIANPPGAVAGEQLDLIVEGWTETFSQYEWDVSLVCSPAALWRVGVYGTSRYNSASTTLAAGASAGATSLSITSATQKDTWKTSGGYSWKIAGAIVDVTSVTSPAGTAPNLTQTATVTWPAGGVLKALPNGSRVRLWPPQRYGV